MQKKVFILGCERSGSTWLANIFDSHPQVQLYMEPFADFANIFPGFPGRNIYLSDENHELNKLLSNNFQKLYKLKNPFFYRPGKSLYYKSLDDRIVKGYEFLGKTLHYKRSDLITKYRLLNLNQSETPASQQFRKDKDISTQVIKDLRLNFKLKILSRTFPKAKYIIIIRHPGAQISSILKLFRNNNLSELKKSLYSFFDIIRRSSRFEKYSSLLNTYFSSDDIEMKLLIWWIINYEVLVEDAARYNMEFEIVYHENLSKDTNKYVEQIFEFCGIMLTDEVKHYLKISSQQEIKIKSPINTIRHSVSYYQNIIKQLDKSLLHKIESVFSQIDFISELKFYYDNIKEISPKI